MSEKEKKAGHKKIVTIDKKNNQISIKNRTFTFDAVYGPESTQEEIYEENFRELVSSVLAGFNGTVFAYGQTGTGKTFTMEGVRADSDLRGMIPRAFDHIFTPICSSKDKFIVKASYLEIYKEEIRDLLSADQKKKLTRMQFSRSILNAQAR